MRHEQFTQSRTVRRWDTVLRIAIWPTWGVGCVVGVIWCWLLAATTAIGPVTPDDTAYARALVDTAATVSVVGASTAIALATALLVVRRGRRPIGAMLAILVAVASPWLPLQIAMNTTIAGE